MSEVSGRVKVEIICVDGTKIKIYNGSWKNFERVKQWVEDINNGLKVEDLTTEGKPNICLKQAEVESEIFTKAEMVSFW